MQTNLEMQQSITLYNAVKTNTDTDPKMTALKAKNLEDIIRFAVMTNAGGKVANAIVKKDPINKIKGK